jgi:membrane protein YdbS with pleckstrin-like domain
MTNLLWLIILSLLFAAANFISPGNYLLYCLGLLALVLLVNMMWSYMVLYNITYIIDSEQIIIKRGVFMKTTDYVEMYRIYDYQKRQNIIEVAFGLMNIVLLSRDLSTPQVKFTGINNSDDVIPVIRERVENEKQRKHVVELNNPHDITSIV